MLHVIYFHEYKLKKSKGKKKNSSRKQHRWCIWSSVQNIIQYNILPFHTVHILITGLSSICFTKSQKNVAWRLSNDGRSV